MKFKIIIVLAVLLTGSLSASPNKCGKGVRCAANAGKQSTTTAGVPHLLSALRGKCGTPGNMMVDDAELLPMHHYLNKF